LEDTETCQPGIIAAEIVEDRQAALDQFTAVASALADTKRLNEDLVLRTRWLAPTAQVLRRAAPEIAQHAWSHGPASEALPA